jgi:hypothetical protein
MNQHFLSHSISLPTPVPVVGSLETFPPQLSAAYSNSFALACPKGVSISQFDPTVEQLFPPGVAADLEKHILKNIDDGLIGIVA